METVTVLVEQDPLAPQKAEVAATALKAASRQSNSQRAASSKILTNWIEEAKALGLALYERQPEENDIEWLLWTTYRDHYPGRMPSMSALAQECGCGVATATKTATKWNFRLRMVEWSRFVDAGTLENRLAQIKEMNRIQLEQAKALQATITDAITLLDPATLKPNEIATLMKLANDTEKRIVESLPEKVDDQVLTLSEAQSQAKHTDANAIGDILNIMANCGALGKGILGIEKKTVTTERVVLNNDNGGTDNG